MLCHPGASGRWPALQSRRSSQHARAARHPLCGARGAPHPHPGVVCGRAAGQQQNPLCSMPWRSVRVTARPLAALPACRPRNGPQEVAAGLRFAERWAAYRSTLPVRTLACTWTTPGFDRHASYPADRPAIARSESAGDLLAQQTAVRL